MWFRFIYCIILFLSFPVHLCAESNGEVLEIYTNKNGRKVEKIHWEGTRDKYVLVSYPKNFDLQKIYHINFWFPGTSGKPGQGIEDENDQYIGIGLSYIERDKIPKGGYCTSHWDLCKRVEASVVTRMNLKIGTRILSGVSKGGWLAFHTSLDPPKDLDGVAIIAAGKNNEVKFEPKLKNRKLAILVGTGETDSNFPYAQLAIPFYKKAPVESLCYEEWLREGHVSKISPKVNEWLDVQARRHGSPEELIKFCEEVVGLKLKEVDAVSDEIERYIALRHLVGAPSMFYISKATKSKIFKQGRELVKSEPLKKWLVDFKKIRVLIDEESSLLDLGVFETEKLGEIANKYKVIATTSQYVDIKERAAYAYLRSMKMYSMYQLRDIAKKAPEYAKLQKRFDALQKKVSTANRKPEQKEIDQLYEVANKLSEMRGEIAMKSFYDIEWYKKYDADPAMIELMEQRSSGDSDWQAYSGIGF